MFYDSNQVDNELLCKHCEGRLVEPKFIPCGEIICSSCEASIQVNDRMFDCLVCKDKHDMPKNGLPICKPFLKLLSILPTDVSRGKSYDLLEMLLNEMQKKNSFIKLGIENSNDFVKEHCMNLRSDVQLTAEEVILQVNEITTKIIEEIDEYEKELIEFNKTNKESLDAFNKIVKEMESFHAINTEYLKKYKVDYQIINKANEEATNLIKKAELEIENLKDIIFDGQIFMFEKNNEKISKSILGVSKIVDNRMNSAILSEKYQTEQLVSLCEFPVRQKWDLIYRASKDGFEAVNFHSKCDNKSNTLVIVKSANGNVFGGYTEQTWNHTGSHKADYSKSFILSLINKLNKPIKLKWSKGNGINCHNGYGPSFGSGHDLHIANQSNPNLNSFSCLGNSYIHPDYAYGSGEAKSFLAGSFDFQVSEIEVYTKQ